MVYEFMGLRVYGLKVYGFKEAESAKLKGRRQA